MTVGPGDGTARPSQRATTVAAAAAATATGARRAPIGGAASPGGEATADAAKAGVATPPG